MDSSEIDFSKENIQPLKEGRLASCLGTALDAQCNIKSQNELLKEREKFELELRKYNGDDPLGVWYKYICWVIQAYPSNEVADVSTLIYKCLGKFKDDERYHQDVRYVKVWIKYIEMQLNPFETFDMIHKHGIGSKCAEFYKSWAEEYEKTGDFKQAARIYAKGFEYGAQPAAELAQAQRNFEDRFARQFAMKSGDDWMESNAVSEQRLAFSRLATTTRGKTENVGSLRTGSAVLGSAGILKSQKGLQQKQKPAGIQIFKDNQVIDSKTTVPLEKLPLTHIHNQENTRKPGKWNTGTTKRPAASIASTPVAAVPFKMHEDESSGKGLSTPGGLHYTQNVLKVRKVEKDDFDCPLAIFEPLDPTKIVMYCKDKVYSGGTEFSLEEIRAIKYFEAEEKKAKEMQLAQPIDSMEFEERQKAPHTYQPSPMQQFDFLSAPSPTINTRAANAMMNELFSSTFTQSLGDSLLVAPQQPHPNAPKFEIPCDDNATFPDMLHQEEKIDLQMPKAPGFSIHCNSDILFQETPLNDENNWKPLASEEIPKDWGAHIPFVPPPEDKENIGGDDGDSFKENIAPQDYHPPAAKEKHPLASILLPSKNVPFKPLATEEEEMGGQEVNAKNVNGVNEATEMTGDHNAIVGVMEPPVSPQKTRWELSLECEMLRSLNDVTKNEVPSDMKTNASNHNEVNMACASGYSKVTSLISQKSNGGISFKQKSTVRTVETEIFSDFKSSNKCIPKQIPKQLLSDPLKGKNDMFPFAIRDLWGKGQLSHQCEGGLQEIAAATAVETVENPTDMLETLLGRVALPVSRSRNFYRILQCIPCIKTNDLVNLRQGLKLTIQRVIGSTADAKLFLAVNAEGETIVIKFQHMSCEWEFYIVREIRDRLEDPRMFPAFSNILEAYLFNADGSMLLTQYLQNGTFIELLNMYKTRRVDFPEVLVLFFTVDLVNSVRHLHGCKIIHGSIRPENFLVGDVPNVASSSWKEEQFKSLLPVLQLINMGKCIDMSLFPRNVRFTSTTSEGQCQCIEIQNGRPWTYQIDLYGIAFTMHCMIFGEYMDISCQNGIWNINRKLPSHFNSGIWNNLFHSLLNVPSCDFIPNLQSIQAKLQEFMFTFEVDEFVSAIANMQTMLEEKHRRESSKIWAFKHVKH